MGNTATEQTRTYPIQLKISEKGRAVVVEDSNEDRYVTTVEKVIIACRANEKEEEFKDQFDNLKQTLGTWISSRNSQIVKAFITVRDTYVFFLLITKSEEFELGFEKELTDLDLQISHSECFNEIPFAVQSLPDCGEDIYEGFLDPTMVLEYNF